VWNMHLKMQLIIMKYVEFVVQIANFRFWMIVFDLKLYVHIVNRYSVVLRLLGTPWEIVS
jgi:hypothetical protein